MRRLYFLSALAFMVVGAAGCATRSVSGDYSLEAAKNEGVVIVSVSHDLSGRRAAKAIFYFNGGAMEKNGGVLMSLTDAFPGIPGGSDFEDSYGKLFALTLPAGHHSITSWQISNGSGLRIFPAEDVVPLEFNVTAGKVQYLGNLHGNLKTGKNIFGMTIVGNGYPEVRDERVRDLAVFREKFPRLTPAVEVHLLRRGPWVTGLGGQRQIEVPPPAASLPAQK